MSIISCTSPSPSALILPFSSATSVPSASLCSRSSIAELAHRFTAARRGHVAPAARSRMRRCDRGVEVPGGRARDAADRALVRGIDRDDRCAVAAPSIRRRRHTPAWSAARSEAREQRHRAYANRPRRSIDGFRARARNRVAMKVIGDHQSVWPRSARLLDLEESKTSDRKRSRGGLRASRRARGPAITTRALQRHPALETNTLQRDAYARRRRGFVQFAFA